MYGALLGRQKGRSVEVCNSFELVVSASGGSSVLDKEYFAAKEEQCKEKSPRGVDGHVICNVSSQTGIFDNGVCGLVHQWRHAHWC